MVSRTLRPNLVLTLAFLVTACGGDDAAESTTFGNDFGTSSGETADPTGNEGNSGTAGDGDGDPATGDGDGDPTTTGDGDGDSTTGDGDGDPTTTGDGDGDPGECLDLDQDGYGTNCAMGPDCDDANYNVWTDDGCANCADNDGDNYWVGCDAFDESKPGPDCDDADYNAFSESGCANCVDVDMDGFWVGCDQYGDAKPGPDCADNNGSIGIGDEQEICNGLAENCAGEVDNAPPDDMCEAVYPNVPNVAPQNGWACNPPAAGQDGCEISACVEQFFDLDEGLANGCECAGTPRTESLAACSGAPQGYLGNLTEGTQLNGLVVGSVPLIDNGIGNGAEDWYWLDIPEPGNPGVRPNTGSVRIDFQQNDNNDYRFSVHRSCASVPFDNGLATQFGAGAPPAREWWFFDNHVPAIQMPVPALYQDNVTWPGTVYIRVFRVQNDKTCNSYQLRVQRVSN